MGRRLFNVGALLAAAMVGLQVVPVQAQTTWAEFLRVLDGRADEPVVKPASFTAGADAAPQPAATAAADMQACNTDSGCCRCWYFQGDALYWQRIGTGCDQVVAIDINLTPGADTLLRTSDLSFNAEPGMRLLLGYYPDCHSRCVAWEFSYLGVFDWEDSQRVVGPGNLAIPGQLGLDTNNFFGADIIKMRDTSNLNDIQIDYVRTCCTCCNTEISFLTGFRYINFRDRFALIGTDLQEGTSSYDIDARNNLFGWQLGGRIRYNCCWASLELVGKAGIFLNAADQHQTVTDFPNNFIIRDAGAHGTSAATVAEIGVTMIKPISDIWSIRVGYDVLGIGGLALGPDQLDFTDNFESGTALSKDGYVFFHGVHFGIEACW